MQMAGNPHSDKAYVQDKAKLGYGMRCMNSLAVR